MASETRPLTDAERQRMAWESLERLRLTPGALDLDYCTVGDALDELAALRAAVARLEGERDDERRQRLLYEEDIRGYVADIDRLTAARDAARSALAGLINDAEHWAAVAHGERGHGAWRPADCPQGLCPDLRRAVARARAATGAGGE